jgi:copper chaperone|nr:cation transporter [Cohnella thermotolerans]
MRTDTWTVRGMSCGHCAHTIEAALAKLGALAKVDLEAGTVSVLYDSSVIGSEQIVAAIESHGYNVVL